MKDKLTHAAELISSSKHTVVFTGAGISVESGIPPFRGEGGLWQKYDPIFIDLDYFYENPEKSWQKIREVFYDFMGSAQPNPAHTGIAEMENGGYVHSVITQNIDGLHQKGGSRVVHEFHGTTETLSCTSCGLHFGCQSLKLDSLPPKCSSCGGLIKPDFIFFGEQIDPLVADRSVRESEKADVMIVIGTTGEVMPANRLPYLVKQHGGSVIEINPAPSALTAAVSDIYLKLGASEGITGIIESIHSL